MNGAEYPATDVESVGLQEFASQTAADSLKALRSGW
jgi:hypothetical protein